MLRSDYSRQSDALRAEKERIAENWRIANEEYQRMQGDLSTSQADLDAAKAAADAARVEAEAAKAKVIDPTKFVSVEDYQAKLAQFAAGQTAYFGDTLEAVELIRDLAPGTKVTAKSLLLEAQAAGKTPLEYANEKYKIQELQSARETAAREKEIAEAVQRGRDAAVAEMANPATRPMAESKDPFYVPKPDGTGGQNPWDDKTPPPAEVTLLRELQSAGRA